MGVGGWWAGRQAGLEPAADCLICFDFWSSPVLGYKAQLFVSWEPRQTKEAGGRALEARESALGSLSARYSLILHVPASFFKKVWPFKNSSSRVLKHSFVWKPNARGRIEDISSL